MVGGRGDALGEMHAKEPFNIPHKVYHRILCSASRQQKRASTTRSAVKYTKSLTYNPSDREAMVSEAEGLAGFVIQSVYRQGSLSEGVRLIDWRMAWI